LLTEKVSPAGSPSALRIVAVTVALSLVLLTLEVTALRALRDYRDQRGLVSQLDLNVALRTFRPLHRSGLSRDVPSVDLDPANQVRTEPRRCATLALPTVVAPLDAQSWTGASGRPAEPVTTLTVRYADASAARRALRDKRLALMRCRHLRLTFPPFDQPAQSWTLSARVRLSNVAGDTLSYVLVGEQKRYTFFVARYVNTVTWTYGNDSGAPVRREVVLDLNDKLAELAR